MKTEIHSKNSTKSLYDAQYIPDPNTDPRLLPISLVPGDNTQEIQAYRLALQVAVETFLPEQKRQLIQMHYRDGLRKTDIARSLGLSDSAVSRGIKSALEDLEKLMNFYKQAYKALVWSSELT